MIRGVDISHHNGNVDWGRVKAAGISFAFLKATEYVVDPLFTANLAGARKAGLHVGCYHFFRYGLDWGDQAHTFVRAVDKLQAGDLPPVLDLEDRDGLAKIGIANGARKALAWLNTIEQALGVKPIIYADRDFVSEYLQDGQFAAFPLWLAAYTSRLPAVPAPWRELAFWQYSEHGSVPGVPGAGSVDLDFCVLSQDRFNALLVQQKA